MGVETICLKEAYHLVRRDSKYWSVVSNMYLSGLRYPIKSKILRAAYFFCRHIDDVLDGDREITVHPKDYVCSILKGMGGKKPAPEIVSLYRFAIEKIKSNENDNPQRDFRKIINAMLFDYKRSKERKVLNRQELESYFRMTFVPALNISMQIGESKLRGNDLHEMVLTMGHIFSIRDMKTDLSRGIINIPEEELEISGLNGSVSYDGILTNNCLLRWIDYEVTSHRRLLQNCRNKLEKEGDASSRNICLPLIRTMESYCKKYLQNKKYQRF